MSADMIKLPFGARLRQLRLDRGMSLSELARRTHFSKGYLSKIENGTRMPSIDLARLCDGALDAGGELIRLCSRRTPRTPSDGRPSHRSENWLLEMDMRGSLWFETVDRRKILATGAVSLLAVHSASSGQARHGPEVAATFGAMFTELRRLGQQTAPRVLLPTLVVQTRTLSTLAREATGIARRELAFQASRYAEYTGWMAQEAGHDQAALWWTDAAVDLATAASDHELSAYSLVRRALIALYSLNAAETVALARSAQTHRAAGTRLRALAALREAQGHALAGDAVECLRAIDWAEALVDGESDDGAQRLGSWTVAHPVALTRAWCLYDLGRGADAVTLFERELLAVPGAAHRFRARWMARYVLALASTGALDQASALVPELVADSELVGSSTVRRDLMSLAKVLARRLSCRPVQAIYPGLVAALRNK